MSLAYMAGSHFINVYNDENTFLFTTGLTGTKEKEKKQQNKILKLSFKKKKSFKYPDANQLRLRQ